MEAFRQAYREETDDLLDHLESALLELSERPDDKELIGRIFRDVHTIKGSGAMVGFYDVAAFTHELESTLDKVRGGLLPVTPELIHLSLGACDQVRRMIHLKSARTEETSGILTSLKEIVSNNRPASTDRTAGSDLRSFHIRFTPAPDLFASGTNPVILLEQLGELGARRIIPHLERIPTLDAIDPERCYFQWEAFLDTPESLQVVRDVFMFVDDRCALTVEEIAPSGARDDSPLRSEEPAAPPSGGEPPTPEGRETALSIRVPAGKLDLLLDLAGELVSVQSGLTRKARLKNDPDLISIAERVERLTAQLRAVSMNIRLLPVSTLFVKFRRWAYDLAKELGKQVDFTTEGGDTELDKTLLERLSDPLVHLIRNSIDHGIETAVTRSELRKPVRGMIHLSAEHDGGHVMIRITDDGAGVNRDAVRRRAVEMGLIGVDEAVPDDTLLPLIFAPGFSTRREVSRVSGRGVGMDVVKTCIESLRGTVRIDSREDAGTTVTLGLPMTLVIIDGLLVVSAGAHYVIPLSFVKECMEFPASMPCGMHRLFRMGDSLVPFIRLREAFEEPGPGPAMEHLAVLTVDGLRMGLAVDEIIGEYQTVIKPLGRLFAGARSFSGVTLLPDGAVALIIDPGGLMAETLYEIGNRM